jgi:CHAT domain-containing protein
MSNKIKVLFLAANPLDTSPLRLGAEAREIDEQLELGSARSRFKLLQHWALRPSDLQRVLLKHKPHIVHFSGHGSRAQEIVLENAAGKSCSVNRRAVANLFRILQDNVRLVVLNACFSRAQAAALMNKVDYTIGTKKAVGDQAAIIFAGAFYRALAFGRSVREAFELARLELALVGLPGANVPKLFVRTGVDATQPFLLSPRRVA